MSLMAMSYARDISYVSYESLQLPKGLTGQPVPAICSHCLIHEYVEPLHAGCCLVGKADGVLILGESSRPHASQPTPKQEQAQATRLCLRPAKRPEQQVDDAA